MDTPLSWALAAALAAAVALCPEASRAGIFEIGAQVNYHNTNFDASHSEAMETGTGTIAYYFWEMSALELSYTRGADIQNVPEYVTYEDFTSYGTDVLFTLAEHDSSVKPYMKFGVAYVYKNIREFITNFSPIITTTQGLALTGGVGLKFMLSQQFGLKLGVDVATSPLFLYEKTTSPSVNGPADPVTYDFSANAGVSFLF